MGFLCVRKDEESLMCNGTQYDPHEEALNYKDELFWVYLGVYIALVLFAGLMSGLTMGLLSLDILSLKVLQRGGKPLEKKHAAKILPLVEKHHLLLVTLLLANAAAVESMPIFMDRISSPVIAICVSVTAVLFFGEVVPQALCTRYGLAIGATLAPMVKLLMLLLFVIAWPISKLLDFLLGHEHSTFFRRAELRELVDLHRESTDANEDPLRDDEVMIIQGALEMRNKTVADKYTPLENVFMLDANCKLDHDTMTQISGKGHSRVPVYEGNKENIVGLLFVKSLIMLDPDEATPIKDVYKARSFLRSSTTEPLFDLLDKFQTGKSTYVPLVFDFVSKRVVGIITLEDVLELLIQEEIWDEADISCTRHRSDVKRKVSLARAKMSRMKSVDADRSRRPLSPDFQPPEEAPRRTQDSSSDTQPLLGDSREEQF
ncbi:DUF21 domain-containing protein At4g33700-like [Stylophora pistillata]|uniref:DUF21 domain-containing protein At4g33700-like n=1 Tax=Stylophora pistillata TaxID=50429 RepID=UPI000C04B3E1|nr:DUF21 domain-containing protein At4g33700-like [Stylophora pistillata]